MLLSVVRFEDETVPLRLRVSHNWQPLQDRGNDLPPPAKCLPQVTWEHSAIHSLVTTPSSSPDPLWKPLLLSGDA